MSKYHKTLILCIYFSDIFVEYKKTFYRKAHFLNNVLARFWCFAYFRFFFAFLVALPKPIFSDFFSIVYKIHIARIAYAFYLLFTDSQLTNDQLTNLQRPLLVFLILLETKAMAYIYLKNDKGKQVILNGFRAAGITEAVKKIRENSKSGLNPYWIDYWVDFVVLKKILLC